MAGERVMAIVGAGHVGGRAAQALREAGWRGGIALIGAESHLPYERPPLSKDLLTAQREPGQCGLRPPGAWQEDGIEHIVATVQSFDPHEQTVRLHGGRQIDYEALLLATGGYARPLAIPGARGTGVHGLRTLDDAIGIRRRLIPGARIVVIGGGFIGLEVAASARACECEVTVVEGAVRLMGRAVPEPIAARARTLHEHNGVRLVLGAAPCAIEPQSDGSIVVRLQTGDELRADTVIVGIGIEPADALARAAGLDVERGIVVSDALETSARNVYAAGDVAVFPSRFGPHRIRQETWHNAETQARAAARNMLGARAAYRELPWFWSDQYDHQLQVAGEPALGKDSVVRPIGGGAEIHFHFERNGRANNGRTANGRLVGASGFGPASALAREMKLARMLVDCEAAVTPAQLVDLDVNLKSLLRERRNP
ncbi:FAD-dependent oxidoreductase [Trinickia caryophylli]|uniref:3-phenylpropionate/trans-cinnamate dioxygenase ferredoxin reductase subunit n=1 Tax=Trinickia caryophylli TaxID=28094 RepID=A0A1X7D401_TRICW|nr:FAD-dependent oxidoreductase [Trinickia caryophylli]PMS12759.1 pyridine nucleotide-disulfide oxidoreductase [Trinickia caryophylli]TRX15167.1 pyridine nucleotide-disulfide oxidoreductase [Trinickia caryophylli]WQE15031.1 FAD-dependent oxidoreductase [Trinickia caryophylli]SMF08434.1 3-phenylpropionate/trans-cinnamate dioxygenase ferredoxin reductase subunit [Trinickia caryophylli]GLU31236.1 ferredoxin reductase [Trinickia caryophylli]